MKQTTLMIDADQLREIVVRLANDVVRELTQNRKEKMVDKLEFHSALQKKLLELAPDFCCYGEKEHPIPNVQSNDRSGRIDVAWWTLADRELLAVFEIDSTVRTKSLRKILHANCPYRFWVYYGSCEIRDVIETLDIEHKIKIIDFSIEFGKKKRKP
ncbi:hypothetical protein P4S93_14235 [Aneurinibacillus thermoaerophilus]|uniref:Uncharacterized protein n=1 Tax=Aneurinibacillus thermoaerophilus TaxID=143495 RepID=A0A1G7WJG6_ANETH|nr:hypothetical protein [Aneurinibacillus thermoaerophilus]MED0758538.1 hypothetical protein [Aneurinibacillus thermoaerophilus]MED0761917.1 hypothetical protein [Aneurinibacillus thermoaerophilus]SDG71340.1 hypothetical protein SAMN04489735_1001239 [Aneurinibacillus thermoaerophilus]